MIDFRWFQQELDGLMPNGDLRLVRDPHRLGLDLWVIERKVPGQEHLDGLEQLRLAGEPRYVPLDIPGIGLVQYDCAPEWHTVHICKSKTCDHMPPQFSVHDHACYREPNMNDVAILRRWLYEFRDFNHSREVLQREQRDYNEKVERTANENLRKNIRSSADFRGLVYSMPNGDRVTAGGIIIP